MVSRAGRRPNRPTRLSHPGLPLRLASLFAMALATGAAAPDATQLAVASNHAGHFCLWTAASPKPGTKVTLISLDSPQTLTHAEIAGPGTGCGTPVTPAAPPYELHMPSGSVPPDAALAAILGTAETAVSDGTVSWRAPEPVTFRSCTSSDGAHLTAWQGTKRVWHAYYYVGADLDADCTAEQTTP